MTHFRVCHLCEAMCGLAMDVDGERVGSVRGDRDDPFGRGYICPKAAALRGIHYDSARLRAPVQRVGSRWVPATWEDALAAVSAELVHIRREHGPDAVAIIWATRWCTTTARSSMPDSWFARCERGIASPLLPSTAFLTCSRRT